MSHPNYMPNLVVVVEQDRGVVHRAEAEGRDAYLTQKARVGRGGEDLGAQQKTPAKKMV